MDQEKQIEESNAELTQDLIAKFKSTLIKQQQVSLTNHQMKNLNFFTRLVISATFQQQKSRD